MKAQTAGPEPPGAARPAVARGLAALYATAAVVALAMGALPLAGIPCEPCRGGALSRALPWIGGLLYAVLAVAAVRRPASALLVHAASLVVFVHADLTSESLLVGRLCWGCMIVAGAALAAGAVRAHAAPPERVGLAAALLLGGSAGFLLPYDRLDHTLTRRIWPARLLEDLPAVVPRDRVFSCEHRSRVRLVVIEKDCKACGSATRRLLPALAETFGDALCTHVDEVKSPPPGTRLPVFVLATADRRLLSIEGLPSEGEMREWVRALLENRPYRPEAAGR